MHILLSNNNNNFVYITYIMLNKTSLVLIFLAQCPTAHAFVAKPATFRHSMTKMHAKNKFTINTNISGNDVSSDGLLAENKKAQEADNAARAQVKSNLGVSSKKKMSSSNSGQKAGEKKLSKKDEKLAKQRNGDVDSTLQAGLALPEDQDVQVQVSAACGVRSYQV